MKKILLFVLCLVTGGLFSQSAGFNNTFIVLSIDGGTNLYYDLNGNTSNYDFQGQNIGTFCQGSSSLIFKGGENNVYKCGGCDLTSTRIYYRIYLNGTAGGNFVATSMGFVNQNVQGCVDQKWASVGNNTNLLSGLGPGTYTIEVYSDASVTCSGGTIYAGNGGANYKANFTVSASVGGSVSGSQSLCSGNVPNSLTLNGYAGSITKWQRSATADFTGEVTDIPNTSATLSGTAIGSLAATAYFRAVVANGSCTPANSIPAAITVSPATAGGTVSGNYEFCSLDNDGTLVLSGHTGDVVKWQSSAQSDFNSGVTDINNTSAYLHFSDILQTTYYRAVVKSGVCNETASPAIAVVINSNAWTGGGGDTDWNNPLNWSCATVPTAAHNVVIAVAATQPVITGNITVEAASLTVGEGASVIVETGNSLIVANAVAVHENGSLTLQDRANLIQVNHVGNTGIIRVEKLSAPMFRLDYALWSSPVAGQTLIGFSPETMPNRFYRYNTTTDTYTASGLNNGDAPFAEGTGYLIRVANTHQAYDAENHFTGTPWAGAFTGVPHNGTIVAVAPAGFNAVGNPYPSAISIAAFYEANALNLGNDAALYFWRKKNGAEYSSYASLTLEGYTANGQLIENANGDFIDYGDASNGLYGDPANSNTWALGAAQGFIVQSNGNGIVFNNGMRMAGAGTPQFRSAQNGGAAASRLWLNMANTAGEYHQAMVSYSSNGTLGIDYARDGKAFTDGAIALYSMVGETTLGIQARPEFDASDVVQLGYKAGAAGSHTISLARTDGLFAQEQQVYLKDSLLGTVHNLKDGPYNFTTEAGENHSRFEITFAAPLGTGNAALSEAATLVYKAGNAIKVDCGAESIKAVAVYDLHGRLLHGEKKSGTQATITALHPEGQLLIVQVTTAKRTVSRKLLF
ncbi:hypothetical protein [uncultured Flavobacterium sp.]|uniref:hypothetical protein n=1 Tax=uncultured Flavobacterium sp. TaxID=165435 RepID=UPI0025D680B5|nr:hypothetical protein [uncultured Flavobacterium sp.]